MHKSTHTTAHLSADEIAVEEAAVLALLQRLNASWGDAEAYGTHFTEDADYVAFDGSHARGRVEIVETHRPLFNGILKGSRLVEVGMPLEIRLLTPDVALLHSGGAVLKGREKKPSRRAISVQTMVAVKQDSCWLFAAFQNTRYRPFADTLPGKIILRQPRKQAQ